MPPEGLGQVRHLAVADLWLQDRLRTKDFELCKVLGANNMADLMAKYLDKATHYKHCNNLGIEIEEGRPATAPKITSLTVPCSLSSLYDADENNNCHVLWQ